MTRDPFDATRRVNRITWQDHTQTQGSDLVAQEFAVALIYNGRAHAVMMATPADLEDFAFGFSFTEGIIEHRHQLTDVCVKQVKLGFEVQMQITSGQFANLQRRKRSMTGRTGCGLCGATALQDTISDIDRITNTSTINHSVVQRAIAALNAHQRLQQLTGAVHAAAWCNLGGTIELLREDVGRHNALDKLLGAMLLKNHLSPDATAGFIAITSRASFEMVAKAAKANVGLLAAVSAPTSLAIELAESCNLTLVGFVRSDRHVIYCGAARLVED